MISVHNKTETIFTGSGLGVVDNEIIDPVVSEELAGIYMLEFTYPTNAPLAKHLIPENLIAAPVPSSTIRQGFRITSVTTSLTGMLQISALHVSYDLAHNLVVDTFVVNQTPTAALTQILGASQYPHSFTATSADTATRASVRIVRTAVLAAIMDEGVDNSFTSRWGGEISRDNFHLHHAPRLGADRGVVIRDAKNLTGYSSHLDYTTITTRVLPVGFDGLLLPEKYVDSPRINDYKYPYVQVIKFEDIKAIKDPTQPGEGELPLSQAHDALRNAAKTYLAAGNDLPTCSYQVRFVELSQTRQYAKFQPLEKVVLGDTVTVIHDGLGVSLKARVVAYTFNPATSSYLEVTLGQVGAKFSAITKTITQAKNSADNAVALAGVALASADGKTTNHYTPTQPALARLGDTWFKPNGETIEIWVCTTTSSGQPGWVSVATDLNHAQISAELEVAKLEVAQAVAKVETVVASVGAIDSKISAASAQAESALVKAEQAVTRVEGLQTQVGASFAGVYSTITQIRDDINLRVSKDGVITQINVSPETILIAGKRIHITGQTSIDNATIQTAMIANAAITDAKIASLDAAKINTGYLAASRIAAGSITSDKLTVANGFITNAMIKDASITSAKIAALDAGKITTGYLSAARIQAGSITADKFAANAIQVGLAGWTSTIRISPSSIAWYNGTTLEGNLDAGGMTYWWGNRKIGQTIRVAKAGNDNIQGLVNQLAFTGDYIAWTWIPTATSTTSNTCLTLDPKGTFHGTPGIHLGADLRTGGYKFYTTDNRYVTLKDCVLTGRGTHPGWVGPTSLSQVVFHTYDLMIISNGTFYNMSRVMDRLGDLMGRVNEIIRRLNYGWIVSITGSGSNISWSNYQNTGLQAMQTTLD